MEWRQSHWDGKIGCEEGDREGPLQMSRLEMMMARHRNGETWMDSGGNEEGEVPASWVDADPFQELQSLWEEEGGWERQPVQFGHVPFESSRMCVALNSLAPPTFSNLFLYLLPSSLLSLMNLSLFYKPIMCLCSCRRLC